MMVDLHTHLLPCVDDGARTVGESLALLQQERDNGVDTVVLTSHFRVQDQKSEAFFKTYNAAFAALEKECGDLTLVRGAEVLYSPYLAEVEALREFCIGDTDYLLLEMPYYAPFDERVFAAVSRLRDFHCIRPILAHVERYQAVRRDPALLSRFREIGCLFQINAASVLQRNLAMRAFLHRLARRGFIDVLASDCHDPLERPVCLKDAYDKISSEFGAEFSSELKRNAEAIILGDRW